MIFSKDEDQHFKHQNIILEELDEAGLKINKEECPFYQKKVKYLRFELKQTSVEMNKDRIKIIEEYKQL